MNDFDKAAKNIGNRFELVLVASERMREIHRKRREQEDLGIIDRAARKTGTPPCVQTISDIESGLVKRDYLNRITQRSLQKKRLKYSEF